MIGLPKGESPQVLIDNGPDWTSAYVAAVGTPAEKAAEKWRHPEIKECLNRDSEDKCAYCEAKIKDVAYGQVDHIKPKKPYSSLAHNWENLAWSCPVCNNNKGNFWDDDTPLLNPYVDPVEVHIVHLGHLVDWAVGDVRAELTIDQLELNRLELADSRLGRLRDVKSMVERWASASGAHREMLESAIALDANAGEFTGSVVAFLRAHAFPI